MSDRVSLLIDGMRIEVNSGITVAAAILSTGVMTFRQSVSGQPRAPLCGMGICFECRVVIDELPHVRSCQLPVREGMVVRTK